MTTTLIQQVRVLDPVSQTDQIADVLIEAGVLQAIASQLPSSESAEVIDGRGKLFAPGLVDLYSHSGEPGFESRETLSSLQQAAAAGGFTRVGLLPTTQPVADNPAAIAQLKTPGLFPWGALTVAAQGQQMSDLVELAAADVVGFTDNRPLDHWLLLRRLLEYAQPLQKPIALWPCSQTLTGGAAREGIDALRLGLPGIPAIAETTALAALLECVAATGTPVHIMRVSTARSVALIAQAKAARFPITASTTWMHLLFSTADLATYDPNLRLDPPLGTPADQQALIEGVQTGTIDAIAVDHTPYTYEEKTVPFALAPPGVIGLELVLPILWQRFVASGQWSALQLWASLSQQPANCLTQAPPTLAVDQPLEAILFEPQVAWAVTEKRLKSLSANTPWLGQTLNGRVLQNWSGLGRQAGI
ncbi:dihydroorotase [Sphaerothrix gracilis]|uniref:dihydroorotase n=1 Tax=Sphaerothrix gracilis TaxID=3151835 RepID=UPI0031FC4F77